MLSSFPKDVTYVKYTRTLSDNRRNLYILLGPFDAWGMDVIGPMKPPSSQGHMFILAATDSFSKWAEAIPLKEVKGETVENLLKVHIIYRFGVPARIISDNGTPFQNRIMERLCTKFLLSNVSPPPTMHKPFFLFFF